MNRWGGGNVVFTDGFLAVPLILLRNLPDIGEYGITTTEFVFILQLMSFKWDARSPYPSYKRIADQMGVSKTYTKKIARKLEDKGLLKRRMQEGTTNRYDLSPLFDVLKDMGEEIDEDKLPF